MSETNNTKAQLTQFLQGLTDKVVIVNAKLQIYTYLNECQSDARIDALNTAPAFFQLTSDAFVSDLIIRLHNLYDPGKDAKRGLVAYLKRVHIDWRVFNPRLGDILPETIDGSLKQIENVAPILNKIYTHRDKFRAHSDKKYFDNPKQLTVDAPLYLNEFNQVAKVATDIIEFYQLELLGVEFLSTLVQAHDVETVIKRLQIYLELCKSSEGRLQIGAARQASHKNTKSAMADREP